MSACPTLPTVIPVVSVFETLSAVRLSNTTGFEILPGATAVDVSPCSTVDVMVPDVREPAADCLARL